MTGREVKRKQYASELYHLTAAEIAEEEALYIEVKRLQQVERRYRSDRDDLMRTVMGLDSGLVELDQDNTEAILGVDKVSREATCGRLGLINSRARNASDLTMSQLSVLWYRCQRSRRNLLPLVSTTWMGRWPELRLRVQMLLTAYTGYRRPHSIRKSLIWLRNILLMCQRSFGLLKCRLPKRAPLSESRNSLSSWALILDA